MAFDLAEKSKNVVIHVAPDRSGETGGVPVVADKLCQALARDGLLVKFLSVSTGTPVDDLKQGPLVGYENESYNNFFNNVPLLSGLCVSPPLKRAVGCEVSKAGIIHSHGLWLFSTIYPAKAARRANVPLIVSPHGMLSSDALRFSRVKKWIFWHTVQRTAARHVTCFHATSEAEARDIRAYGLTAPIALIPNGVDLPAWQEKPASSGRQQVLSLGRIHPIKGLDQLVAAWAQVEVDFPDWDLLIVGPDENNHAEELAAQAKALNLKNFTISGPVFGKAKDELLRASDIFVLPSLSENFGITVAESLAVGTPVISSKGAPWQGVEKNGCGSWVDHGVEPLGAALRETMSLSSEERAAMGARGRAWVERDFSWSEISRQMAEIYRWLQEGGEMPAGVSKE